ncbi:MAG: ATP-binding cassette domain-containing protein [Faecalibacterium sp.]
MTVGQYGISTETCKLPKEEIDRRVNQAAEILGITEYLERKPKALSGGQRQRWPLAELLYESPKFYSWTNPYLIWMPSCVTRCALRSSSYASVSMPTFIYVTHDQTEAMTLGDRIVIMKDGVIQQIEHLKRFSITRSTSL